MRRHCADSGPAQGSDGLFGPAAEIVDETHRTSRRARQTGVATVQNQPVMRVQHEFFRDHALQTKLYLKWIFARRHSGAIANTKHVRVDGHGMLAESHVEYDICRLAAGAGKR